MVYDFRKVVMIGRRTIGLAFGFSILMGLIWFACTQWSQIQRNGMLLETVQSMGGSGDVRLLLDKGADPNSRDMQTGETALMRAGDPDTIQLLLSRGADLEAQDRRGQTPLMVQAKGGLRLDVPVLIAVGADVTVQDRNGNSVLMVAAADPMIVEALLKAGADPAIRNHAGETASQVQAMYPIIVSLLDSYGPQAKRVN